VDQYDEYFNTVSLGTIATTAWYTAVGATKGFSLWVAYSRGRLTGQLPGSEILLCCSMHDGETE
jgi:hypothetical protein